MAAPAGILHGSVPMNSSSSPSSTPAYDRLHQTHQRLYRLQHLESLAAWDQSAFMPDKGNEARAAAMAELGGLMHEIRTSPALREDLQAAQDESLSDDQRANLREIARQWRAHNALPADLVQRRQIATSRCEHAWRGLRQANDWAGFLPLFREVVAIAREEARLLGSMMGVTPYEALMDRFEPGMRCETVDRVFADLRSWLPGLIDAALEAQRRRDAAFALIQPTGPFPVAQQRDLCESAMRLLGFDFEAGRLDVSAHPFCGGVPEDVRMTTRFNTADFLGSLLGTIHETGHGRYEQNLPREWLGQPLAEARSMAVHESQSLSFEMQLARHPAFASLLAPLVSQHFGHQAAFAPLNLHRLMTRVEKGLIRVDADEVTYPAHILLRYGIERALIDGDLEPEDIPERWDAGMAELLGLDTRGNFKDGPLQDVHWPAGLFGYFPSYTLGAMLAAQWFATLSGEQPDWSERLNQGDLQPVFDFLRDRVWTPASRWTTEELILRGTGEALNPEHFRRHLERRYLA
jgi:carboxypeptidase Taq